MKKLFPLALIVAACSGDPGGWISDAVDRPGADREVQRVVLPAQAHDSIVGSRANGSAFALHVGERAGIRAASVFRFELVDSLGDGFLGEGDQLLAASLDLSSLRRLPEVEQLVQLHLVCTPWVEDSLFSSSTGQLTAVDDLLCDGGVIGEVTLAGGDPGGAVADLDTALVHSWIRFPEENLGFALVPADNLSMTALSSRIDGDPPHLLLTVQGEDGRSRIMAIRPAEDTFAVSVTEAARFDDLGERIVVQNGLPRRGLIRFDLDEVPARSTILSAQLVLFVDFDTTYVFDPGYGLQVFEAVEENWAGEFPNLEEDEEVVPIPGTTVDVFDSGELVRDSIVVNIQVPVQAWVNDSDLNQGLLFRTTNEVGDVSYLSLDSENGPRPPRMEIIYVEPPPARWGEDG